MNVKYHLISDNRILLYLLISVSVLVLVIAPAFSNDLLIINRVFETRLLLSPETSDYFLYIYLPSVFLRLISEALFFDRR